MLWLSIVAFLIALLADWKGIFTRSIGDRVAAVLALFTFRVWFRASGLDTMLIHWGRQMQAALGHAARDVNPLVSQFLGTMLLATVALVMCSLWVLAFIPSQSQKYLGGAVSQQITSVVIWVGAFAMAVMVGLIPGTLGHWLQLISSFGAGTGQWLVSWAA